MQSIAPIVANKQLIQTILISASAFLIALPIGGAFLSNDTANAAGTGTSSVASDACVVPGVGTGSSATGTSTGTGYTKTSQSGGSVAQIGSALVAFAVAARDITVGDIASNNNVASNNNTEILSNNSAPIDLGAGSVVTNPLGL